MINQANSICWGRDLIIVTQVCYEKLFSAWCLSYKLSNLFNLRSHFNRKKSTCASINNRKVGIFEPRRQCWFVHNMLLKYYLNLISHLSHDTASLICFVWNWTVCNADTNNGFQSEAGKRLTTSGSCSLRGTHFTFDLDQERQEEEKTWETQELVAAYFCTLYWYSMLYARVRQRDS